LKDSFKIVQDFPEDYTVLLAGDMNLRDKEVKNDAATSYLILAQGFNVSYTLILQDRNCVYWFPDHLLIYFYNDGVLN
jgi:hypothetical protein